jgi:hypothetical protein
MDRQYTDEIIMFNEAAANGATPIGRGDMQSFRNVEHTVVMTGFTGTIKFVASNADTCPDFSAAASLTNRYDYVKCINQIDGSSVNGGTGLAGTATTSVTQLEMNTNGFKWVGAIISGYSAGTLTLRTKGYSNL